MTFQYVTRSFEGVIILGLDRKIGAQGCAEDSAVSDELLADFNAILHIELRYKWGHAHTDTDYHTNM